jgi:hypothetical protein
MINGNLWLHVLVPEFVAASTLDVHVDFCTEALPTTAVNTVSLPQITAAGYYSMPINTKLPFAQIRLDVAGVGADFGAAKVWFAPAHRHDAPLNQ